VAYGLGSVIVGVSRGEVGAVDLHSLLALWCEIAIVLTRYEYRRGEYLQHGVFDAFGLDQAVLLEVVDERLVGRA
jgi:hypothetical protein